MFSYIWIRPDTFGNVKICLEMFRYVQLHLDTSRYIWKHPHMFGNILLDTFGCTLYVQGSHYTGYGYKISGKTEIFLDMQKLPMFLWSTWTKKIRISFLGQDFILQQLQVFWLRQPAPNTLCGISWRRRMNLLTKSVILLEPIGENKGANSPHKVEVALKDFRPRFSNEKIGRPPWMCTAKTSTWIVSNFWMANVMRSSAVTATRIWNSNFHYISFMNKLLISLQYWILESSEFRQVLSLEAIHPK